MDAGDPRSHEPYLWGHPRPKSRNGHPYRRVCARLLVKCTLFKVCTTEIFLTSTTCQGYYNPYSKHQTPYSASRGWTGKRKTRPRLTGRHGHIGDPLDATRGKEGIGCVSKTTAHVLFCSMAFFAPVFASLWCRVGVLPVTPFTSRM